MQGVTYKINKLISYCLLFGLIMFADISADTQMKDIDLIVVDKSQRILHLMKHWQPVYSFKISLGQRPIGHKQQENDSRTPEGFYTIDAKNPDSKFFRSLHISYPDAIDRQTARRRGVSPGGSIMIHGEPNDRTLRKNLARDWTQGCIGLSNEDMFIVWQVVEEGTPIVIKP